MTISTQTFRFSYTSTGGVTYPYTNKILDQDDLKVYVSDVLQTIGTDYTVSGVGTAAGGNVTFLAAPAVGATVLLTKDGVEFTQETDYVENDAFPAAAHEDALDKLTNIAQKIWDYVRRSVKVPITSTLIDLEFPTPQASTYLGWNATADGLENYSLVALGSISNTAYNSTTWDGASTVAPTKDAVRDELEVLRAAAVALISDTAYNSTTWDNVTTIAPSKNAVRDKFESLPQNTSQPAFLAYNSATDADVTGDGTNVTVDFDTEVFDQGEDFATDTFTAPVTGKYHFDVAVYLLGLAASDIANVLLITSNRNYANNFNYTAANQSGILSITADMDAGDTASVSVIVTGGTKDVDIYGGATGFTSFSGFLVC